LLCNNYPNSFDFSDTISFSIPINGFVILTIHDVLGNEVAKLENGYKPAGTYSYTFDASKLTSGIYFYTIKASDFAQTQKMILLR
jgi:hypothetical protein